MSKAKKTIQVGERITPYNSWKKYAKGQEDATGSTPSIVSSTHTLTAGAGSFVASQPIVDLFTGHSITVGTLAPGDTIEWVNTVTFNNGDTLVKKRTFHVVQ
jgi:LysM repeat protein